MTSIQYHLIDTIPVTAMETEDCFFDHNVTVEYQVSDQHMSDEMYYEFLRFVKENELSNIGKEFSHDQKMSKVTLGYVYLPDEMLVVLFEGPVSYIATSKRWVMTKFIEDFNNRSH